MSLQVAKGEIDDLRFQRIIRDLPDTQAEDKSGLRQDSRLIATGSWCEKEGFDLSRRCLRDSSQG